MLYSWCLYFDWWSLIGVYVIGATLKSCSLQAGSKFGQNAIFFILPNSPWFKKISRNLNYWGTRIDGTWLYFFAIWSPRVVKQRTQLTLVYIPIMLSIRFKIIHVAALWYIHGIFVFSFFGSGVFNEFARVFHDKVSPKKSRMHYELKSL